MGDVSPRVKTKRRLLAECVWVPFKALLFLIGLCAFALVVISVDAGATPLFLLYVPLWFIFAYVGFYQEMERQYQDGADEIPHTQLLTFSSYSPTTKRYAIRSPITQHGSSKLCSCCRELLSKSGLLWGSPTWITRAEETYAFQCYNRASSDTVTICADCELCRLLRSTLRLAHHNSNSGNLPNSTVDLAPCNRGYGTMNPTERYISEEVKPKLKLFEVEGEEGRTYLQLSVPGSLSPAFIVHHRRAKQRVPRISDSTESSDVACLARQWIETCTRDHGNCRQTIQYHPRRLIHLLDEGMVQVVERATRDGSEEEYVALSHCWGPNGVPCKLTANTYERFTTPFAEASMPNNLRHASAFTRALGYHYIWIDSLCIIQDSPSDQREEIMAMSAIYSAAVCTIAATASAGPEGGCFRQRESSHYNNCELFSSNTAYTYIAPRLREQVMTIQELFENKVETAPLNRRAWTFQERLLSRRIIHFSESTVLFECNSMYASEWHLDGIPHQRVWYERAGGNLYTKDDLKILHADPAEYIRQPYKIPFINRRGKDSWRTKVRWTANPERMAVQIARERILKHSARSGVRGALEMLQTLPSNLSQAEMLECHRRWYELVSAYSARSMTYRTDRLKALAGLASSIRAANGIIDFAGMWEPTLAFDLLWAPTKSRSMLPGPFIAPSWSWASANGQVESLLHNFRAAYGEPEPINQERRIHVETSMQFADAPHSDDQPTFEAFEDQNTHLLLRGPVRAITAENFPIRPDHENVPISPRALCLLVYSEPSREYSLSVKWAGLIVQAIDASKLDVHYERVGSVVTQSPRDWVQEGWKTRYLKVK